jgi:DNA-binding transcriptional LysR family regulator
MLDPTSLTKKHLFIEQDIRTDKSRAAVLQFSALRYFHEVAQVGSIRQAAERLHVAPSAVSRQIAKIEHEYGALLFERRANGVRLTAAGKILMTHLGATFRSLSRARSEIDDLKGLRRGEIIVHCIEGLIGDFLPEVITQYHSQFPNITFNIVISSTDRIVEALASDETDIGITFFGPNRADVIPVINHPEPLVALMAPWHPLATMPSLQLEEIAKYRIAMPDSTYGVRRLIDKSANTLNLSFDMLLTTNSIELARSLARKGDAITLSPRFAAARDLALGELVAVPVDDPNFVDATTQVSVRRDRRLTVAAKEFIKFLEEAFLQLAPPKTSA